VPLDIPAVALPLRRFYRHDGRPRFSNRAEVEAMFGIAPHTRVVLIGSGRANPIEAWWRLSEKRGPVLAALRALGVALITGPNYSMFTDEVRYNDMHAMKRIGTTWQEIVAAGISPERAHAARLPPPRALHCSEVGDVAFEFKDGRGVAQTPRLPSRPTGATPRMRGPPTPPRDDRPGRSRLRIRGSGVRSLRAGQ
jgi:hypothetical protein